MQRFLSTPLFRAHRDKSRTKLVCEASASAQVSRRKGPMHRSFCKKSLINDGAPKPAGRGARGRGVPENRDSQARRVVRSHTHGEPILPPNFRRRVAGVPPVRREALRVGSPQFQSAVVKTPCSLNFGKTFSRITRNVEASPAGGGGWAGARETRASAPHRASSVGIRALGWRRVPAQAAAADSEQPGTGCCDMLNDRLKFSSWSMCP